MIASLPARKSPAATLAKSRRERQRLARLTMAVATACGLALTYAAPEAGAATTNFNNAGASSWFTGANWDNGVPTAADVANIITGTAQIGAPGAVATTFQPNAAVSITAGGTLTVSQSQFGPLGVGTVTVDGAGATFTNNGLLFLASNNSGTLTIQNGGVVVVGGDLQTTLVAGTAGTVNLNTGGTLRLGGGANGFNGGPGTDVFNFAGGTLQVITADLTSTGIDANMSATSTIDTNGFNMSFAGVISGAGGLNKNGAGTLTLTGNNTYLGTTTINAGVLSINNGSALGTGTVNVINGSTLLGTANATFAGNSIVLNDAIVAAATGTVLTLDSGNTGNVVMGPGNVTFGSAGNTGVVAIGNNAAGSTVLGTPTITVAFGTLRNAGGSPSPLSFFTANALSTTVNAGARLDTNGVQTTIANLLGAGTLVNDGAALGTFNVREGNFSGVIQDGAGVTALTKSTAGTLTFTGAANNTYTGPTNIEAGTVLLDTISAVNSGIRSAEINIGDGVGAAGSAILRNVGFTENISDVSAVTMNSDGLFDLNNLTETIGSLAGTAGQVTIGATATLATGGNNTSTTYAGSITGGAASTLIKQGTGTWTLTSANAGFLGQTTVAAGRLWAQDPGALGGAAAGATAITTGGILRTTGLLNLSTLNWGEGNLQLAPGAGTGDVFTVTTAGGFQNTGGGGTYSFDPTGLTLGTTFTLTNYSGATNFGVGDFAAIGLTPSVQYQGIFTLNPTNVQFTLTGATVTGNIIQNSAPVNTPTFADFIVNGPATTGGPGESNTIKSLTFQPNSSLTIFNTLFVTGGQPVNLTGESSLVLGSPAQPQGNLSASQLNILFGSTLRGNGTIFGNVVNAGLVSPGYSPGTIAITGNYTQTSTGTLRIEIGGTRDGEHDLLRVGGTANLDGTLDLVRINRYRPRRGDKVTFLTAAQGVDGEFAHVNNPFENTGTILESVVVYHETSVTLEMVRGSFGKLADRYDLTPNQRAVAGALDGLAHDDDNHQALRYLDERYLGDLPGDFDRIAPEELTSIFTISTSLANVQGINLQRRTDDIRHGAAGFSAAGLAMNGTGPGYSGNLVAGQPDFRTGVAGPTGDSKESKEIKEPVPMEENKWGVFLSGTGEWVNVDGDGNARGYDLTTGGFTLGLDYKIAPNFAIGIAAGYAGTSTDLTGGGSVLVNGGKLGLYATYFTGGFYADAAVTGGYNSYDTKRSALQGTARGSTDGGELNVLVGTGYDWKVGALTIGPTATFQYTLVGIDGFTETGSLAPLTINGRNAESVRTSLGFKASYDWKVGGVLVRPEIRAAWQHEFGDSSYALDASFSNGAGNNFLVNGPELGRDSLLLGAGFAVQCSETFSTYFYYDGELGRKNYDRHGVSGGVRVAF